MGECTFGALQPTANFSKKWRVLIFGGVLIYGVLRYYTENTSFGTCSDINHLSIVVEKKTGFGRKKILFSRMVEVGGSGIKEEGGGGGGGQRHIAAFCNVWLSSGSRRSLLIRRYRSCRTVGCHFPGDVSSLPVKAERPQKRQGFCSFLISAGSDKNSPTHFHEKKKKTCRTNQTALSVREILLVLSGRLVLEDTIYSRFFLGLFLKKGRRGAFSVTFSRRTIFFSCPLVVNFNVSTRIHAHEHSTLCSVASSVVALHQQLLVFSWDSSVP